METRTYGPTQNCHPSSAEPNTTTKDGHGIASTEGYPLSSRGGENPVKKTTPEEEMTMKEVTTHSLTQDDHPSIAELIPIPLIEDDARQGGDEESPLTGEGWGNPISLIENIPLERNRV